MDENKMKALNVVRTAAILGCLLGFGLFVIGMFASGFNYNHIVSITGIMIALSSVFVFGGALMIMLISEGGPFKQRIK
ncbi:hypothetical protein ACFVHQ_13925 [Actinomycetes bacterium NPDC127524]|uniref:hypothetical protein n=1 Tax=Bacillus sp. OV322 TaxID=1882764 RepID=UPI0008E80588|nr:hypothetical protein [Bacillus sp. OV322]SFC88148.1 hypothetical protein SAMN05443252_107229 [Bacillus sp. OV322]